MALVAMALVALSHVYADMHADLQALHGGFLELAQVAPIATYNASEYDRISRSHTANNYTVSFS